MNILEKVWESLLTTIPPVPASKLSYKQFCYLFLQLLVDLWRFLQKYKKTFEFSCLFVELHYFKVILTLGFVVSLTKVCSNASLPDFPLKNTTFSPDNSHSFFGEFVMRDWMHDSSKKATCLQQLDIILNKRSYNGPNDIEYHHTSDYDFQ